MLLQVLIILRFHVFAKDLLESVKKMEDSLKRLQRVRQTNRSSNNLAATSANYMSDDDKIRLQLSLDIKELMRQIDENFGEYRKDSSFSSLENLIEEINITLNKQLSNQNSDKAINSNFLVIEENETSS